MSLLNDLKHPGESTIGWALTQAARLHRTHLNAKLADLGLFAGQEQVLDALASQGVLTIGALASMLRVRVPTASKMVTRLAVLGFVQRDTGRKDTRTVSIGLTRKGRTAVTRLQGLWDEVEHDLMADFDLCEQEQLNELLIRAVTNLSTVLEYNEHDFGPACATHDDQQTREHQSSRKTAALVVP
jgi:DNA-binding MarR family transcriptional regulator